MIVKREVKDFDVIISQPLCCKSRRFNKILIERDPTETELLEIEVFLKLQCPEFYMLVKLYEDCCVRKENERKARADPATNEYNRRAGDQ